MTSMSTPEIAPDAPRPRSSRRTYAIVGAVALVALLAFVMVYFQPHKLFIDDEVDEAAPTGAVPIGAGAPVTEPITTEPMEEPMASDPMGDDSTAEEPMEEEPMEEPAGPMFVASQFISLDHGTSGTLVFLEDPSTGQRFVRFEGLETDNGPDLKVYLSTNPIDGPEGAFDDDFVDLGRLQGNIGDQNYEIPADTDLTRFASVVIWCDRFDSAFGAAPVTTA
jgi:hypothetical protein